MKLSQNQDYIDKLLFKTKFVTLTRVYRPKIYSKQIIIVQINIILCQHEYIVLELILMINSYVRVDSRGLLGTLESTYKYKIMVSNILSLLGHLFPI